MKQIATIIFCMFFFAQAICSSKSHPIRAYINEHVKPALKQQRLKLEASISLEDKKQIEDLRIKLKALRANKPKGDKCSKPEQMDIQHQQRKQAKREIMKEAKLLAQKYQGQIEVLYKELEPIRIQWKADLEKLVSEQSKDTCHCQKRKPPFKRLFSPAHFILMNPNEGEAAGNTTQATAAETKTAIPLSVSPNPTHGIFTLNFDLAQPSVVEIKINNQQGIQISHTAPQQMAEGAHQQQLNLNEQNAGVYIVQVIVNGKLSIIRINKI